jgi:hypothetical protein
VCAGLPRETPQKEVGAVPFIEACDENKTDKKRQKAKEDGTYRNDGERHGDAPSAETSTELPALTSTVLVKARVREDEAENTKKRTERNEQEKDNTHHLSVRPSKKQEGAACVFSS